MPFNDQEKKVILDFFELFFDKLRNEGKAPIPKKEPDAAPAKDRLIPLSRWNEFHKYPTVAQLRCYRFNGQRNGFNSCIRQVGRKLFINESLFFEWINQQSKE